MQATATLDSTLRQAQEALRQSQPESALAITAELIGAYPDAVRVWRARAEALEANGQHDAAAEAHARVLDVLPADAQALAGCARTLAAANRPLEAADIARHALDHTPDDARLREIARLDVHANGVSQYGVIDLARGLAQAGEFNRGIGKLRRLIENQPTRADARLALAEMLWRHSIRHVAAEQCSALLSSHPNALAAHAMLMALARRSGQVEVERRHAAVIARLDPDRREVNALLGAGSPLRIEDAPVDIAQQLPLVEDEETSSAWVNELIASSSAAPSPNAASVDSDADVIDAVADDLHTDPVDAKEATAVSDLEPLDWRNAGDAATAGADAPQSGHGGAVESHTHADAAMDPDDGSDVAIDIIAGPEANLTGSEEIGDNAATPDDLQAAAPDSAQAALTDNDDDEVEDIPADDDASIVEAALEAEPDDSPLSEEDPAYEDEDAAADPAYEGDFDEHDRDLPLPRIISSAPPGRVVTEEGIEVEPLDWSRVEGAAHQSELAAEVANPAAPGSEVRSNQTGNGADDNGGQPAPIPPDDADVAGVIAHKPRPARRKPWQMPEIVAAVEAGTIAVPVPAKAAHTPRSAGKPDDVLESARQALAANQLDAAAGYFDQLTQRGKRLDDVISELSAATQAHPNSRRLLEALGNAHSRKGNMTAALEAYRKALAAL